MNSTVQNFLEIDYSQASAVFPPRVLSKHKRRLEQLSVQILELEQKIEKKLRKQNPKYGEWIQKKRVEVQELYDEYDRYIRELNLEGVDDREAEVLTNNVIGEDTIQIIEEENDLNRKINNEELDWNLLG